jgi:hypothetical protein
MTDAKAERKGDTVMIGAHTPLAPFTRSRHILFDYRVTIRPVSTKTN